MVTGKNVNEGSVMMVKKVVNTNERGQTIHRVNGKRTIASNTSNRNVKIDARYSSGGVVMPMQTLEQKYEVTISHFCFYAQRIIWQARA